MKKCLLLIDLPWSIALVECTPSDSEGDINWGLSSGVVKQLDVVAGENNGTDIGLEVTTATDDIVLQIF